MVTEDGSSSSTGLWSAISAHSPAKASPRPLTFGLLQELGQSRGEDTKQPVSRAALTWSTGRCLCPWQGGWNQRTFKVPSNPKLSMILITQAAGPFPTNSVGPVQSCTFGREQRRVGAPVGSQAEPSGQQNKLRYIKCWQMCGLKFG